MKIPFTANELHHCLSALFAWISGFKSFDIDVACQTLTPAAYMCMDRLLPFITEAILSQVEVDAIVGLYRMAQTRHPPLAHGLWQLLIRHFDKIQHTQQFLTLSQDELLQAMDDERLNIASKEEMSLLSKYVQAKPRQECDKVVALAVNMSYTGDGAVAPVVRNRLPTEVVMTVGGWWANGPTDIVETYNTRNGRWIRTEGLNQLHRAYHGLNVVDGKMIICGGMNGREYFSSTSSLDMATGESQPLANMTEQRCYLSTVVVPRSDGAKRIMIIGGFNGQTRLDRCEYLELEGGRITSAQSMNKARSDGAAVLLGETVAAVGGFDGRQVHQDVELHDMHTGSWYNLTRRMRTARTGVCAVAISSSALLVVGGFNGHKRLASAEIYDTREGVWHAMPSMITTRSNYSLESMNGRIYAVGGFDGNTTTATAERLDLVAQRWEPLQDLSVARSALRMVRVEDQELIRRLVHFDDDQ